MNKINVMSAELANMIAAGEVIERPSSVIKELVENSIDANSKNISVDVYDVGRKLIRVQDDGDGMSRDDAVLAFRRHASSKLKSVYDLMTIDTLGFRGEAVPSIASISNVKLFTSDGDKEACEVDSTPNEDLKVLDSSLRKGTTFEVRELFYNTPARLKYLKSDRTENANSIELMEHLALGFPEISFNLSIDDKPIFKTTGRGNLLESIANIYGNDIAKKMIEVKYESDLFTMTGYICHPSVTYSNRYHILTFLNNRSVYIPKIQKAIIDGFKDYIPRERYPLTVIKLSIDHSLVDVNVHPAKREVRLSLEEDIASQIYKEIQKTLLKTRGEFAQVKIPEAKVQVMVEPQPAPLTSSDFNSSFSEFNDSFKEDEVDNVEKKEVSLFDAFDEEEKEEEQAQYKADDSFVVHDSFGLKDEQTVEVNYQAKSNFPTIYPLGQVLETYIVCDSEDGLYIVDQHAAAERINFEKCEDEFDTSDRSMCLFPLIIDLPRSSLINYDAHHKELLESMNIYTSSFGGNSIRVDEVPSFLKDEEDLSVLRDIITEVLKDNKVDYKSIKRLAIATKACKMSIKANRILTKDEQVGLLNRLSQCRNPLNCPHGRPTIIKISKYDIEKLFKRTGF